MLASLGKSKQKVFGSVVITSLLSTKWTPTVIMSWLNCWKSFCWFYYAETKDIVFAQFHFLICLNYFQLLFVVIILWVWSVVCLELRLLILFLLFVFLFFEALILLFQQYFLPAVIFCVSIRFNFVYNLINWTAVFWIFV